MQAPLLLSALALLASCAEPRSPLGSWEFGLDAGELERSVCIDFPDATDGEGLRLLVAARVGDALPDCEPEVALEGERLTLAVPGEWTARERDRLRRNVEETWGPGLVLAVDAAEFLALGTTLEAERARVLEFMAGSPNPALEEFNALPPTKGGPPEGVTWLRKVWTAPEGALADHDLLPVRRPEVPFRFWAFEGAGLSAETGADGRPALRVKLADFEAERLARFSEAHQDQVLVIACGRYAVSAPRIVGPIRPSFVLSGMFTQAEVERLVALVGDGSPRPWIWQAGG